MTLFSMLAACGSSGDVSAPKETARSISVIVDATELASAFEGSESKAAELYSGKIGRIHGQFAKYERVADGQFAMMFKTSKETFRPIRCIFDSSSSSALSRLTTGDRVTVTGNIAGFSESRYFVTVEDCLIAEEQSK